MRNSFAKTFQQQNESIRGNSLSYSGCFCIKKEHPNLNTMSVQCKPHLMSVGQNSCRSFRDKNLKKFLITGGAGFIGSAVIRHLINDTPSQVLNVDKLTYASNLLSLEKVSDSGRYSFAQVDIADTTEMTKLFESFEPSIVMNLAAESHVDRSIDNAESFINTNVIGTYRLLEVSKEYWNKLSISKKRHFLFHHISTDEVFGDLGQSEGLFSETSRYQPSSPYAASKACSDHLVRAWMRTYSLPSIITNCSNNYGPYQNPEKLIPLMIMRALAGESLPIYGDGKQVRDWLFVEDHARALVEVALRAEPGSTYNIGGGNEITNINVVKEICKFLDQRVPQKPGCVASYGDLIEYVNDRPGHDFRYAVDARKIANEIGWVPREDFYSGLRKTVEWYLENNDWLRSFNAGENAEQGHRVR
tara:strand:- start:2225 stop:3475 length:1251 start_codon:yes stop_codon:yes gene_type:complete